jgi:hypothetical protein
MHTANKTAIDWADASKMRFWSKVQRGAENACWPWMGSFFTSGYGQYAVERVPYRVHRCAYELVHGRIPSGMVVMHICDNPPCCNPKHLRVGTTQENTADRDAKGRTGHTGGKSCPGALNPAAKLNDATVLLVRSLRRDGWTLLRIATKVQMSQSQIRNIVTGKCWAEGPWPAEAT